MANKFSPKRRARLDISIWLRECRDKEMNSNEFRQQEITLRKMLRDLKVSEYRINLLVRFYSNADQHKWAEHYLMVVSEEDRRRILKYMYPLFY